MQPCRQRQTGRCSLQLVRPFTAAEHAIGSPILPLLKSHQLASSRLAGGSGSSGQSPTRPLCPSSTSSTPRLVSRSYLPLNHPSLTRCSKSDSGRSGRLLSLEPTVAGHAGSRRSIHAASLAIPTARGGRVRATEECPSRSRCVKGQQRGLGEPRGVSHPVWMTGRETEGMEEGIVERRMGTEIIDK